MLPFLRRLWVFVRPHQRELTLGLLCGVLSGLANAGLVLSLRWVMNGLFAAPGQSVAGGFAAASRGWTVLAIASVPIVLLVRALCGYLNAVWTTSAAARTAVDLRLRLFDHLQNRPLSFFDKARSGELISRITGDTALLYTLLSSSFSGLLRAPATLLALAALLLAHQPLLGGLVLAVMPLCVVPILWHGRRVRQATKELQSAAAEWTSLMQEVFSGNRLLKAYQLEPVVLAQGRDWAARSLRLMRRVIRHGEFPQQTLQLFGAGAIALALTVAFRSGQPVQPGDAFQFVACVYLMVSPIQTLARLHSQFEQARAAGGRIFDLLDERGDLPEPTCPRTLARADLSIEFASVSFRYGETPVLRDFKLRIEPGEFVALVGASGSGKSTVVNLLMRFYDPTAGAVRVGGIDLRELALEDLRQRIALVAQESLLFNDTVRQNIAYGRPGATDAEIEAVARAAGADDFIRALPQGYATRVGERGGTLSGGQRQRVAIARALLKDAPILVLDEATNALDAAAERAVQEAVRERTAGRAILCIAHRLSAVQTADRIVVLEEGQVAESGTHAELLQAGGLYARLWSLQSGPEAA